MKRPLLVLLSLACLSATAACGANQQSPGSGTSTGAAAGTTSVNWPKKGANLTLLLPVAAGGTTDTVARIISPSLEKELGVNIQVVNKPGAEQQLGLTQLASSKADGYTIGFTNLPSMISGYKNKTRGATYDRASFTPVAAVAESASVVAAGPSSPYKSLDSIIDAARTKRVTVGITGGALGDSDLLVRKIETAGGVQFARVPIGSGSDIAVAIAGGQIDFAPGSISTFLPLSQAGKVAMIAVLSKTANPVIPNVPTAGNLDVNGTAYLAISGPKGLDPGIVQVLNTAIQKVMSSDDIRKKISAAGSQPTFMGSTEMNAFWTQQDTVVGDLVAKAQ